MIGCFVWEHTFPRKIATRTLKDDKRGSRIAKKKAFISILFKPALSSLSGAQQNEGSRAEMFVT